MVISNQSDSWRKAIICNPQNNLKSILMGGIYIRPKNVPFYYQILKILIRNLFTFRFECLNENSSYF